VSPSTAELLQRAVAHLQQGDHAAAQTLATTALRQGGPEPNAFMVLGGCRAHAGDLAGAIELYERARALLPTHRHVLVNLAAAYRASGRLASAREALETALHSHPEFAAAHNNLGNVLAELGERAAARRAYQRASALDPAYAEPLAAQARLAEEEHRLDEARALAERARQLAPQDALALLTLARVRLRTEDAAGAIGLLESVLADAGLSSTNRTLAYGALGDAYDRLGRYPEAFAAYTEANRLQYLHYAPQFAHDQGPLSRHGIRRLRAFLDHTDVGAWQASAPVSTAPVFLVGFPRSGTTLLDQMLASHPDIATLEERDTLADAVDVLLNDPAGLDRWAHLPGEELERLRARYWERVRGGGIEPAARAIFIDKQPLNAVLLPLIQRLFPAARIILALRDPRDVVLSCYQQRFGMNAAMYQLLRLDTASAYYDAVMDLVAASRKRLPLDIHTIKYEEVIGEFEATLRALLGFLGLEWDERVRAYAETAQRRAIGTPSAAQVVRPLYVSARGKWRRYRSFLEPILPRLAPWVVAYSYEP
jgi:tetratricopeptide (TPR) repeat protein